MSGAPQGRDRRIAVVGRDENAVDQVVQRRRLSDDVTLFLHEAPEPFARAVRHGRGHRTMRRMATPRSWHFTGRIAGWGTPGGTRLVLGAWHDSPLGAFADVMVERPDGERLLLAPSQEVADFVASTYTFDTTLLVPVSVTTTAGRPLAGKPTSAGQTWRVDAGPLTARLHVGARPPLGRLLRLVPRALATAPALTRVTDPVARVVLRGVRTRGSAGGGRTEHYGAHDLHRLAAAGTLWEGEDLGPLHPLDPPVRFGFGSSPRDPSVTDLVTTVREARSR